MMRSVAPFQPCLVQKKCYTRVVRPAGASGTGKRPVLGLPRRFVTCHAQDNLASSSKPLSDSSSAFMGDLLEGPQPEATPTEPQAAASAQAEQQAAQGAENPSSWDSWLKLFEQMDTAAETQEELRSMLQDAIRQEDYARAATLKRELSGLDDGDSVAAVTRELTAALQEQRYEDAARLRDAGMAGLQGWWSGSAEGDPVGHLLHIGPEYGRWTGRAYTARDLADLSGWREGAGPLQLLRAGARGGVGGGASAFGSSFGSRAAGTVGSPAMEVFVRRAPGSGEILGCQAVSLVGGSASAPTTSTSSSKGGRGTGGVGPAVSDNSGEPGGSSVAAMALSMALDSALKSVPGLGPVAKLAVTVYSDGSTRLTAVPSSTSDSPRLTGPSSSSSSSTPSTSSTASAPSTATQQPPAAEKKPSGRYSAAAMAAAAAAQSARFKARFQSPFERAEAEATLRELADLGSSGSSSNGNSSSSAAAPSSSQPAVAEAQAEVRVPDEVVQMPEIPDETLEIKGLDRQAASASSSSSSAESPSASSSAADELSAFASSNGSGSVTSSSSGSGAAASPAKGAASEEEDEEDGDSLYTELHRVPAEIEMLGRDAFLFRVPRDLGASSSSSSSTSGASASASAAGAAGGASSSGSGANAGKQIVVNFEMQVPLGLGEAAADALVRVAERVARVQEAQAGHTVRREDLAAALRQVVRALSSGQECVVDVPAVAVAPTAEATAAAERAASSGRTSSSSSSSSSANSNMASIKYTRVATDASRTDPFSGLFIGSFGPHGPELLRLQRTSIDGEEAVVATKLTGDANVPAGVTSFRAKIGRKHKLPAHPMYPDDLGVVARYKGEGRVAQKGYSAPRWVEGELLVFASGGSPLTGAAELGFVWAVPGERRFLILLNKVDLAACAERP